MEHRTENENKYWGHYTFIKNSKHKTQVGVKHRGKTQNTNTRKKHPLHGRVRNEQRTTKQTKKKPKKNSRPSLEKTTSRCVRWDYFLSICMKSDANGCEFGCGVARRARYSERFAGIFFWLSLLCGWVFQKKKKYKENCVCLTASSVGMVGYLLSLWRM